MQVIWTKPGLLERKRTSSDLANASSNPREPEFYVWKTESGSSVVANCKNDVDSVPTKENDTALSGSISQSTYKSSEDNALSTRQSTHTQNMCSVCKRKDDLRAVDYYSHILYQCFGIIVRTPGLKLCGPCGDAVSRLHQVRDCVRAAFGDENLESSQSQYQSEMSSESTFTVPPNSRVDQYSNDTSVCTLNRCRQRRSNSRRDSVPTQVKSGDSVACAKCRQIVPSNLMRKHLEEHKKADCSRRSRNRKNLSRDTLVSRQSSPPRYKSPQRDIGNKTNSPPRSSSPHFDTYNDETRSPSRQKSPQRNNTNLRPRIIITQLDSGNKIDSPPRQKSPNRNTRNKTNCLPRNLSPQRDNGSKINSPPRHKSPQRDTSNKTNCSPRNLSPRRDTANKTPCSPRNLSPKRDTGYKIKSPHRSESPQHNNTNSRPRILSFQLDTEIRSPSRHKSPQRDNSYTINSLSRQKSPHSDKMITPPRTTSTQFDIGDKTNLSPPKYQPRQCPVCHKMFRDPRKMAEHKRTSHVGFSDFVCPICCKDMKRQEFLDKHIRVHERSTVMLCRVCGKVFKSEEAMQRHNQIHNTTANSSFSELSSRNSFVKIKNSVARKEKPNSKFNLKDKLGSLSVFKDCNVDEPSYWNY